MIECIMCFLSGFLIASLLALILFPVVHHRAVRITRRRLESFIPKSLVDMQADKAGLWADFAISTRRLERNVEQLNVKSVIQQSEIGQKAETISRLKSDLARTTASVNELARKFHGLTSMLEKAEYELESTTMEAVSTNRPRSAKGRIGRGGDRTTDRNRHPPSGNSNVEYADRTLQIADQPTSAAFG